MSSLWLANGLPEEYLNALHLSSDPDPAVNSSFKLGTVAQTTIGLAALSAALLHDLRTGEKQSVSVNARHAALEFTSESWYLCNGKLPQGDIWDTIAGVYRTKDDRFVHIHTNFPHHKQGILDLLKCQDSRAAVQTAILQWNAEEFETIASAKNLCVTAYRTFAQWDAHPQSKALRNVPPVELFRVAEAPKRMIGTKTSRPLQGIRVLDLTRVLAGPIAGRTLAAHGAEVLLITSPRLPAQPIIDRETSRGKRTTPLDLCSPSDANTLGELVKDADVFLQAYRPWGLHDKAFGVQEVERLRPGIVYASLTAYGWGGPWENRRGFDSLVQNAIGIGHAEAEAFDQFTNSGGNNNSLPPKPLPCQAIDHAAGYLLAFGINAALCKTITEGGSWEVRVSLAAVGQWIRSLGQLDPKVAFGQGIPYPPRTLPQADEISALAVTIKQARKDDGDMTVIGHAAKLEKTPVKEGEAPMVLNLHEPRWM
ncbi:CoA-transferase family III [Rickenella mellea]|uniref:CoA-transferase family III n=1 Tax=Rickenella mellea TaxID=50990 RepID=A0A4Y7Q370_9AGAM|nr:CoA-transferase family III [Rickenella mellea]